LHLWDLTRCIDATSVEASLIGLKLGGSKFDDGVPETSNEMNTAFEKGEKTIGHTRA
jgi:hypothetical protein